MKVFLNKVGEIEYIDCNSDEFLKIYSYFKNSSYQDCPYTNTLDSQSFIEKYKN